MAQNQNQTQTLVAEAPRLSYGPDVVSRMQAVIRNEIDKTTAAAHVRIAQLQQAINEVDAHARREVAELEQAMRDILRDAAPDPGAFPQADDLADNPAKNLDVITGLHNAQDAREGVTR